MKIEVIPLKQKLPDGYTEHLFEASYKFKRNGRTIIAYERGTSVRIAKRKLYNLLGI